jgi:hypothetical protein
MQILQRRSRFGATNSAMPKMATRRERGSVQRPEARLAGPSPLPGFGEIASRVGGDSTTEMPFCKGASRARLQVLLEAGGHRFVLAPKA